MCCGVMACRAHARLVVTAPLQNALKANAKLQAELSMQTEGIQAMMDKYKTMESEYTKLVKTSVFVGVLLSLRQPALMRTCTFSTCLCT